METVRSIHIIAGTLVGVLGIIQLLLPKKGAIHRTIGNIYTWSWTPLIITGIMIGNLLIGAFGILGWYMALSGFMIGKSKKVEKTIGFQILIYIGFIVGLAATFFSVTLLYGKQSFGIIGSFFGLIFLLNSYSDYRLIITKTKYNRLSHLPVFWMIEHIKRMSISYIAAMTAFFVIQKVFSFDMLNWLLPTLVGTTFIFIYIRNLENKYLDKQ